jgi:hypothetical protein
MGAGPLPRKLSEGFEFIKHGREKYNAKRFRGLKVLSTEVDLAKSGIN